MNCCEICWSHEQLGKSSEKIAGIIMSFCRKALFFQSCCRFLPAKSLNKSKSARKNSPQIPIILDLHVNVPLKIASLSLRICPPAPSSQALSGPSLRKNPKEFSPTFSPKLTPKSPRPPRLGNKKETHSSGQTAMDLLFLLPLKKGAREILRGTLGSLCGE